MTAGGSVAPQRRARDGLAPGYMVRVRPGIRRAVSSQPAVLGYLAAGLAALSVGSVLRPTWFPITGATIWILVGGFLLRMRYLLAFYLLLAVAVLAVAMARATPVPPGAGVILITTALLVAGYARGRERVGVQGPTGASMIVDLRDRLQAQGVVPPLGPGWRCETVLRSAYGDSFSGDFLVASRSEGGSWLELVLVDVSGKGQQAGTRALLLSGAFGGLLGALPRAEFLPAANRYLHRQQWDEGFATAVHLALDLDSGAFEVSGAGHPPAAHFRRGSGRWEVLGPGQGPLLGVLIEPAFPPHHGVLEPGDALLLYTDGLVETRDRDIDSGIDRLIGQAERVMTRGFGGGATRIVDGTRSGEGDDRALVLVWRS